MSKYIDVHVYWSIAAFLYFAGGAALCSVILSVTATEAWHVGIIVYTVVGIIFVSSWIYYYSGFPTSRSIFSSTCITVKPDEDTEYGVVHALYIHTSFTVIVIILIFWIWFLIYLLIIKNEDIERVLDVYCVVFLPLTFLILLFFLASWWIPASSRTVCTPELIRFCSKTSPSYIQNHSDVKLTW